MTGWFKCGSGPSTWTFGQTLVRDWRCFPRMASAAVTVVAFLVIACLATIVFATDPNNQGFGMSPSERSGPISSWPAAWTDFCGLHPYGTDTTTDEIVAGPDQPLPNQSLNQLHGSITSSASFKNATAGLGWVTIYWGLSGGFRPGRQRSVRNRPVSPTVHGPCLRHTPGKLQPRDGGRVGRVHPFRCELSGRYGIPFPILAGTFRSRRRPSRVFVCPSEETGHSQ
jgi:hypothetical protein